MNQAQENRPFALLDALGEDFYLVAFTGHEGISRPFSYQLTLQSRRNDRKHKPEELIYKDALLRFYVSEDKERFLKGYINRYAADYQGGEDVGFHVEMVPWLWFLTQTSDCRIFENKTIPEIIEDVFKSDPIKNIAKFKKNLQGDYPKLEYCVQYRETDFNFVSRLMEQAGIFYFFDQSGNGQNSDTLILADNAQAYFECQEAEVLHRESGSTSHTGTDDIIDWEHRYEFVSGKWVHSDHTFKAPYQNFETNSETKIKNSLNTTFKKYELYDFPGEFVDSQSEPQGSSQGTDLSKVRIGEEEHPFDRVVGSSICQSFAVGGKFKFKSKRAVEDNGKTFTIVTIQHSGTNPAYHSNSGEGSRYSNSYSCIPDDVVYHPPRVTPKPSVAGIQTATVVGPDGEEIHCDEHARIKCLFHWARPKNKDRKKPDTEISCWVRVAQASAGKKWGFLSIPRIGQEVVIDFLDGDPDRPLVVGSVYNSIQETAYKLPDEKARTYFKTNSTPGGDGFNELFFDDKAEKERIFLHAQKDLDVRVRNDSRNRTYGNRSQIIGWVDDKTGDKGGSQREMIYQDKEINVKRNLVEHIEGNQQLMIGNGEAQDGGNLAIVIEKNVGVVIGSDGLGLTNEGDAKTWVKGAQHLTVDGDLMQKSKSLHFTVAGDYNTHADGTISTDAGADIHTKAGNLLALDGGTEICLNAGMKLCLEAGADISLKVGGNFISINQGGVFIQGTLVNINSGGSAQAGSGVKITAPTAPETPPQDVTKAAPTEPDMAHEEKTGFKSAP